MIIHTFNNDARKLNLLIALVLFCLFAIQRALVASIFFIKEKIAHCVVFFLFTDNSVKLYDFNINFSTRFNTYNNVILTAIVLFYVILFLLMKGKIIVLSFERDHISIYNAKKSYLAIIETYNTMNLFLSKSYINNHLLIGMLKKNLRRQDCAKCDCVKYISTFHRIKNNCVKGHAAFEITRHSLK